MIRQTIFCELVILSLSELALLELLERGGVLEIVLNTECVSVTHRS